MSKKSNGKRSEEIWVKVLRAGYIPQLGMQGPVPNPIKITRGRAHSMIVAGISVYEIDPKTRESKELTLQNIFEGEGDPQPVVKEAPKKDTVSTSKPVSQVTFNGVKVVEPTAKVDVATTGSVVAEKVEEPVKKVEESVETKTEVVEDVKEGAPVNDTTTNTNKNNNYNNKFNGKNNKK